MLQGWHLIPIHFFTHFYCMMYMNVSFNHNTQRKNKSRQNFHIWNAIPDAAFPAVRFCSCITSYTQYNRPSSDSQASCFLLFSAALNSNERRYSAGGKTALCYLITRLRNAVVCLSVSEACGMQECLSIASLKFKFNLQISRGWLTRLRAMHH